MCQTCEEFQKKIPDYLCKSCAHAKQMDAMLAPYSEMVTEDAQPYVEFSDKELK